MREEDPFSSANSIDDDTYRQLSALIHDSLGLSFNESSRFFLEKRIESRMAARQIQSASSYLQCLLYDSEREKEWESLISVITTNETYFMREMRQLDCFRREILPAISKNWSMGRKLRIWSAGCSSGEEPYSLAILIRESGEVMLDQVEIYATDINARVLTKAKEGVYSENSFRAVDEPFKRKWFSEVSAGRYQISEELRRAVTFGKFNLFDADRYAFLTPFDVIFCRNVIIYFDIEAKIRVVDSFYNKMRPGGFLLLGHSESLISITDKFKLIHLGGDLVYIKECQ